MSAVSFKGSLVLFDLPSIAFEASEAFAEQSVKYWLDIYDPVQDRALFLRADDCVIDSGRQCAKLKAICRRVSSRDWKTAEAVFEDRTGQTNHLREEALLRFQNTRRRLIFGREAEGRNRLHTLKTVGAKCGVGKKIKKYAFSLQVAKLRLSRRMPLQVIAAQLGRSLTEVAGCWARVRGTAGDSLVAMHKDIQQTLATEVQLEAFFAARAHDLAFLNQPLRVSFARAKTAAAIDESTSFDHFYHSFRKFRFKYRDIKYAPKCFRPVQGHHLSQFHDLYLYFLIFENRFELIFVDESSVCPSNFKRKSWSLTGTACLRPSRIRYEKIMMLAAITRRRLLALQFLHSNFGSKVFLFFLQAIIAERLSDPTDRRQLVVLLDNCSSHRSAEILAFCKQHNVVLLYNLPRTSPLNPIEHLWEYLKRPFRSMTDYKGWAYQESTDNRHFAAARPVPN